MEKCAQSMLLVAVSLSAGSHGGIWTLISMSASFFDSLRQFSLLSAAFFGLLFGVEALSIHDCGDVDIHTLIASSEQQQQQQGCLSQACPRTCVGDVSQDGP